MAQGQVKWTQLRMATIVLPELSVIVHKDKTYSRGWLAQRYHMWKCNSIMLVYKWDVVTSSNGHENNKIYRKGYYIDRRPDYGELKTEDEALKRGLKFRAMRPFKPVAIKFRPIYSRPAMCLQNHITFVMDEDEDHVEECESPKDGNGEPAYHDMDRPSGNPDPPAPTIRTELGSWNLWRHMPQETDQEGKLKYFQYIVGPHLLFAGFEATDHISCRIFADISVKGRSTTLETPPGLVEWEAEMEEAQEPPTTEEAVVLGE